MRNAILWKHLILWLCVIMMAGCVSGGRGRSVGRMIDTSRIKDLQKGQSKGQIHAWFGLPSSTSVSEEKDNHGRPLIESWTYSYGWSNGVSSRSQTLIVFFDKGGKVIDRRFNDKSE